MDIHQKLILLALGLLIFMYIAESLTKAKIVNEKWWTPIRLPYMWLSTPTIIALCLLLLALCVRER